MIGRHCERSVVVSAANVGMPCFNDTKSHVYVSEQLFFDRQDTKSRVMCKTLCLDLTALSAVFDHVQLL